MILGYIWTLILRGAHWHLAAGNNSFQKECVEQ